MSLYKPQGSSPPILNIKTSHKQVENHNPASQSMGKTIKKHRKTLPGRKKDVLLQLKLTKDTSPTWKEWKKMSHFEKRSRALLEAIECAIRFRKLQVRAEKEHKNSLLAELLPRNGGDV